MANSEVEKRIEAYTAEADKFLRRFRVVVKIEEATKQRPSYVVIPALLVLIIGFTLKFGGNATTNLIGFIYPAYASLKAIKTEDKSDDTQLLTYWFIYALFTVYDSITSFFLDIIPFYYFFKCLFLIWCSYFNGATFLFEKFFGPGLSTFELALDALVNDASKDELMKNLKGKMNSFSAAESDANNLKQKVNDAASSLKIN